MVLASPALLHERLLLALKQQLGAVLALLLALCLTRGAAAGGAGSWRGEGA
jgi:hypothetical protein